MFTSGRVLYSFVNRGGHGMEFRCYLLCPRYFYEPLMILRICGGQHSVASDLITASYLSQCVNPVGQIPSNRIISRRSGDFGPLSVQQYIRPNGGG